MGTIQYALTANMFNLASSSSATDGDAVASNDAYESATIALAVIAGISIVIIILLVVYVVRRIPINGTYLYSAFTHN